METLPAPGLVWIDHAVPACVFTGEPLDVREARIQLVGTGDPPESVLMAWSEGAGCWYAHLPMLLEWSLDAGISPADAGPFRIDGEAQAPVVHFADADLTLPWNAFAERMAAAQSRMEAPPPSDAEVAALPQLPEEWQLAIAEIGVDRGPEGDEAVLAAVIVDAGGQPRTATLLPSPVTADALARIVRTATAPPAPMLTTARPSAVVLDDADLAPDLLPALAAALEPAGVGVRRSATPLADEAMADLRVTAGGAGAPMTLDPLFSDASDDELRDFLAAADAFYDAAPWTRLRGDAFVAVQDLDAPSSSGAGAPWLYISVMGQMGDEPGLGLFTRWLDVCTLVHDGGTAALDAGAHLEGVTLLPPDVLDPDEATRLDALGARPRAGGQIPTVTRMGAGTMSASSFPLPLVTAMLTTIREAVAKRRAKTISSIKATREAAGTRLALRYPADGTEDVAPSAAVRLVIGGDSDAGKGRLLGEFDGPVALGGGDRLIIEGPAATKAYALGRAVKKAFEDAGSWGRLQFIFSGGVAVWNGRARAAEPGPRLDHLAAAPDLAVVLLAGRYDVQAERLPAGAAPELRAWIEPAA